jgi:hypothetical protein
VTDGILLGFTKKLTEKIIPSPLEVREPLALILVRKIPAADEPLTGLKNQTS